MTHPTMARAALAGRGAHIDVPSPRLQSMAP